MRLSISERKIGGKLGIVRRFPNSKMPLKPYRVCELHGRLKAFCSTCYAPESKTKAIKTKKEKERRLKWRNSGKIETKISEDIKTNDNAIFGIETFLNEDVHGWNDIFNSLSAMDKGRFDLENLDMQYCNYDNFLTNLDNESPLVILD